MPRSLTPKMESATLQDEEARSFRVFLYDIQSTAADAIPLTFGDVVNGSASAVELEITNFVSDVALTERGSDGFNLVPGSVSAQLRFVDSKSTYDPVDGSSPGTLKAGNVIRVVEGFTSIDFSEWVNTFTGRISSRPARDLPDREGNSILTINAEDRTAEFVKMVSTSPKYEQGQTYNDILVGLATSAKGLALTSGEYSFGTVGVANTVAQKSLQFVEESPFVSIAKVLFVSGFVPRFDGSGVLRPVSMTVDKSSSRVLTDSNFVGTVSRPQDPNPVPNQVFVKGISADMERVLQDDQVVATAGITMGFWTGDSSIRVVFSDDKSILVQNPRLRIIQSVRGGIVPFGDEEEFEFTVEDTDPTDLSIAGTTEGKIKVDGAFYAPLVTSLFAGRIAASFIPDAVVVAGVGASSGSTIPQGRIIEGAISVNASLVQAQVGTGQYEILGQPYEYVFKELVGEAIVANLRDGEKRAVSVENHLITSQADVDATALRELRLVRKRGNIRSLTMRHDLKLEADDKLRLADDSTFIITNITRNLSRGSAWTATLGLFETTVGVNP